MPNPSESLDQVSLYHYIRFTGVVCWCLFEVDFGVLGGLGVVFWGVWGGPGPHGRHLGAILAPRWLQEASNLYFVKIWPRVGSQVVAKLGPS